MRGAFFGGARTAAVCAELGALLAAGGPALGADLQLHRSTTAAPLRSELLAGGPYCDVTLWEHVYAGDRRRFSKPQDRLKIIKDCVVVTGVIRHAAAEKDGDFHIRLKVDPPYEYMLNDRNRTGQHGDLVLESVCSNPVSQRDTLDEGVCDSFSQRIYHHDMLHKHVRVMGAYVTDMEHGWNEIHPVTSISVMGGLE